MNQPTHRSGRQRGFAYVAAVVLLVVMAAMAAAVVNLNLTQAGSSGQELQGLRAAHVARAGVEWGLHRARANPCAANTAQAQTLGPETLDEFVADTGFRVTVTITCTPFREGEVAEGVPFVKIIYDINAVACNGTGNCPADAATVAGEHYVERRRIATACTSATAGRNDCFGDQ